jgi:hypothetical protein
MPDFFRMAQIADDQPTMPSSEDTGENSSSFSGQISVLRSDSSIAQLACLRFSVNSKGSGFFTPAIASTVQKYDLIPNNSSFKVSRLSSFLCLSKGKSNVNC